MTQKLPPLYDQLEVEPDRYIPLEHISYGGDDPHSHVLNPDNEAEAEALVGSDYPYIDHSFYYKFWNFLYYLQSRTLINFLQYFRYGFRLKGKENITKNKHLFKNGAMTVCNHVFRWDMSGVFTAIGWRQLRFPIWRGQMAGKDARRMHTMGGIPIPASVSDMKKFYEALDYYHQKGYWIHFFAEESRWEFYTPIRPFKKGAFNFAMRLNVPIIPMAYSYRERTGILKWFGKEACVTLNVGEPILPNPEITDKRAQIDDMRRRCHEAMVKLAGIKKNPWTYNQTEK
ncbi:MAG: 1-acyl-sn-glycerol-3-phosphate acyltransferase [Paludibacteraceae bacterium]|nr:1-acyl-sn-glycerol-3-phosphate acyltransferase [Paludibacteraceae bacterium]